MAGETLIYQDGDTELHGYVVVPKGAEGPRPAVLVSHAWAGLTDFERNKCEHLASLGYVGVALDNYGGGKNGSSTDENAALMTPFMQDRAMLQRRLLAGYDAAKKHAAVDAERIAAIGFCFGGLCVLDIARSGAPLRGVVSFHGLLKPSGLEKVAIKSKVLVLHGYDDPMGKPDEMVGLGSELTEAGADWQIHAYGGTMHAFTNPQANDPGFGTVYSERAERRSLTSMASFLAEALA